MFFLFSKTESKTFIYPLCPLVINLKPFPQKHYMYPWSTVPDALFCPVFYSLCHFCILIWYFFITHRRSRGVKNPTNATLRNVVCCYNTLCRVPLLCRIYQFFELTSLRICLPPKDLLMCSRLITESAIIYSPFGSRKSERIKSSHFGSRLL